MILPLTYVRQKTFLHWIGIFAFSSKTVARRYKSGHLQRMHSHFDDVQRTWNGTWKCFKDLYRHYVNKSVSFLLLRYFAQAIPFARSSKRLTKSIPTNRHAFHQLAVQNEHVCVCWLCITPSKSCIIPPLMANTRMINSHWSIQFYSLSLSLFDSL